MQRVREMPCPKMEDYLIVLRCHADQLPAGSPKVLPIIELLGEHVRISTYR